MPLDLYFPLLSGGIAQGINDPGIETFEGEFQRHIVRECTQNALDAPAGVQVRVEIRLRQIPAAQIPGLPALRAAVQSTGNYWRDTRRQGENKTEAFCRKALAWTDGGEIAVLEVSDYGTTGLEGGDDDRHSTWFGLVRSGGVSIKPEDAAGAYGIGKDAPFAGSFIRSVFYSSLNGVGGYAFQGVAKLATHRDPIERETQRSGFIGLVNAAAARCDSVRDVALIPEPFRRTERGTSLFVIAYRHLGADDWTGEFIREAVENFWPAIQRSRLVFQIGEHRVDAAALPALMSRFSGDPEFISRFYHRAVVNANRVERTTSLPHLGACRLHLVPGDATYPKRICMTRQTGMVIYEAARFRSYRPFAGLFICESSEGNTYLRKLEPPRHDKWDATRGEDVPQARRVLQSIRDWINQCLRELNPDEDAREADVPELNRYLPDEEDEPLSEEADNVGEQGGDDGIVTAPLRQPLIIQEVAPRPPTRQPASGPDSPDDGQEEGGGSGGGEIDPGTEETETPGGQSDTTGGGATGQTTPHGVKTLLQTRSIRVARNTYELFVRSAGGCRGRLVLVTVGEDNKEDKDLRISTIQDAVTGNEVAREQFSLDAEHTAHLRVAIDSLVPVSLRAYCHGD